MGCVVQSTLKAAQTYTTIEMKTVWCERLTQTPGYCAVKERCFIPAGA
jgi:hypothetical protein